MFNEPDDFYQRLFKENDLKKLDSYAPPTQGQLQKLYLKYDQAARCRTINYL